MHEHFMLAALQQAWLGRGLCAPNPAVGAVAVRNGDIITQAFHAGVGSAHAEQKLFEKFSEATNDLTIYVTLEPCNHWGRTPPCVDTLIAKKVKCVVYGYCDPNPIAGTHETKQKLQAHGIEVIFFPMPEIDAFYESYAHWVRTKKPWVTVKIAQTFDGKIAGPQGVPLVLSNQKCFEFTHQQRLHTDVILTTAKTINRDNPALNVRNKTQIIQSKKVAILDREGIINPHAVIFKSAQECFIYHREGLEKKLPCKGYPILSHAQGLNLNDVFNHLGELGFHDVWVEAGAELFTALHQSEGVQRTFIYLVPRVLGASSFNLYQQMDLFARPKEITWMPMDDNIIAKIDWK